MGKVAKKRTLDDDLEDFVADVMRGAEDMVTAAVKDGYQPGGYQRAKDTLDTYMRDTLHDLRVKWGLL